MATALSAELRSDIVLQEGLIRLCRRTTTHPPTLSWQDGASSCISAAIASHLMNKQCSIEFGTNFGAFDRSKTRSGSWSLALELGDELEDDEGSALGADPCGRFRRRQRTRRRSRHGLRIRSSSSCCMTEHLGRRKLEVVVGWPLGVDDRIDDGVGHGAEASAELGVAVVTPLGARLGTEKCSKLRSNYCFPGISWPN